MGYISIIFSKQRTACNSTWCFGWILKQIAKGRTVIAEISDVVDDGDNFGDDDDDNGDDDDEL